MMHVQEFPEANKQYLLLGIAANEMLGILSIQQEICETAAWL
jgi:hypothetical protein